ncbi:hypothetical protein PAHAL_5G277800 [Panicum hallii]|uniref:Uncharacterized protein n=1 Tax=Panicum hallii TaxID=206008 RepID=A0A2T8ILH4_9POAL|nr:hypothetical protein PAHAL_5G277800 [Panicum hallii]
METAWELTPSARTATVAATLAQLRSGSLDRRAARWERDGEVTDAMKTVAGSRVAVVVSPRERETSATTHSRKSKSRPTGQGWRQRRARMS